MRDLKKVLLTGGAGFIGSSLARHLLKEPDLEKLVVLDKLTYAGDRSNLSQPEQDPRFEFVEGDIWDTELLDKLFTEHQFTAVFHLAAESHVDRSIESPQEFVITNIYGTSCLLEAARNFQAPLLHCSSDEVYGSIETPHRALESQPMNPSSPYAASKASADMLCMAAKKTYNQEILITRCTNNYGPRQYPEKLIPFYIHRALSNESLPIYGTGLQIRDWIHVDDHCRGMIAAWRRGRSGRIYHFAGNMERTNLGMARSILDLLKLPHDLIEHTDDRPGHDNRYALDIKRTFLRFGWEPKAKFQKEFPKVVRAIAADFSKSNPSASPLQSFDDSPY